LNVPELLSESPELPELPPRDSSSSSSRSFADNWDTVRAEVDGNGRGVNLTASSPDRSQYATVSDIVSRLLEHGGIGAEEEDDDRAGQGHGEDSSADSSAEEGGLYVNIAAVRGAAGVSSAGADGGAGELYVNFAAIQHATGAPSLPPPAVSATAAAGDASRALDPDDNQEVVKDATITKPIEGDDGIDFSGGAGLVKQVVAMSLAMAAPNAYLTERDTEALVAAEVLRKQQVEQSQGKVD
jgi:hypothetical protein